MEIGHPKTFFGEPGKIGGGYFGSIRACVAETEVVCDYDEDVWPLGIPRRVRVGIHDQKFDARSAVIFD